MKYTGRICPILNHPLKDGVLVDDEDIVSFIQKRNLDFLRTELVCRWCKQEVIKLYNKKRKKAYELYKQHCREDSVSTLKTTSKSSSSTSSVYGGSEPTCAIGQEREPAVLSTSENVSQQRQQDEIQNGDRNNINNNNKSLQQINGSNKHSMVQHDNDSLNASAIQTNGQTSKETNAKIISENANYTVRELRAPQPNVTKRKKTLRDYLTPVVPISTLAIPTSKSTTTATSSTMTHGNPKQVYPHQTALTESDISDDGRRHSQEPTTSKAAATQKRPIRLVNESDDEDDESLSFNAARGIRLPGIQPHPPKRKPQPEIQRSIADEIMNEYIKDITGG